VTAGVRDLFIKAIVFVVHILLRRSEEAVKRRLDILVVV
jgi:hypothetical protein